MAVSLETPVVWIGQGWRSDVGRRQLDPLRIRRDEVPAELDLRRNAARRPSNPEAPQHARHDGYVIPPGHGQLQNPVPSSVAR